MSGVVLLPGVKNRMDMPNRRQMDEVGTGGGSVETCGLCNGLYRQPEPLMGASPVCHGCRTQASLLAGRADPRATA